MTQFLPGSLSRHVSYMCRGKTSTWCCCVGACPVGMGPMSQEQHAINLRCCVVPENVRKACFLSVVSTLFHPIFVMLVAETRLVCKPCMWGPKCYISASVCSSAQRCFLLKRPSATHCTQNRLSWTCISHAMKSSITWRIWIGCLMLGSNEHGFELGSWTSRKKNVSLLL